MKNKKILRLLIIGALLYAAYLFYKKKVGAAYGQGSADQFELDNATFSN